MIIQIRLLKEEELAAAHVLEEACYTPDTAASLEAFRYRQAVFPAFFLSAWEGEHLAGLACGVRTNAKDCQDIGIKQLHGGDLEGTRLCILSVAVAADKRGSGVGRNLLQQMTEAAGKAQLEDCLLMCQPELVAWYRRSGYEETGSVHKGHGGLTWHEMVRPLP